MNPSRPRLIINTLAVLVVSVAFVRLGIWQLSRLEERRELNLVYGARMAQDPVELVILLDAADGAVESLEYRWVRVEGEFLASDEKLVRGRTNAGVSGFHVLTPFVSAAGTAVIVNRGWVPLRMDHPPVAAAPPEGIVSIEALVRINQEKPRFASSDPPGVTAVVSRIDLDQLSSLLGYPLAPVWLQLTDNGRDLPVPLDPPDVSGEGPHAGYAIQWFAFAVILLVAYGVMLHRNANPRTRHLPPLD